MSGSGIPTMGRSPITMPMLMRVWAPRSAVTPSARSRPSGSRPPPARARRAGDLETSEDQERVGDQQQQGPHEPPHLGEHGKDEIRMALREKGEAGLGGAGDPLAQE